jgi:hypothetical protein
MGCHAGSVGGSVVREESVYVGWEESVCVEMLGSVRP